MLRRAASWCLRLVAGLLERAADWAEPEEKELLADPLPEDDDPAQWELGLDAKAREMMATVPEPRTPEPKPAPLAGSAEARIAAARRGW